MRSLVFFALFAFFCLASHSMEDNDWQTWTPKEIAVALTKLNSDLMHKAFLISATEDFFLRPRGEHAWKELANLENRLLSWSRAKLRESIVKGAANPTVANKFFQIAEELYKLKNFNSLLTVVLALLTLELEEQLNEKDYISLLKFDNMIKKDVFYQNDIYESLEKYLPIAGKVSRTLHAIHLRYQIAREQNLAPTKSEQESLSRVLAVSSKGNRYEDLEARREILNFFNTL